MKVSEIGELGLLKKLFEIFSVERNDIVVNVGDDAAVVESPRDLTVLTTDLLIEDIHFRMRDIEPYALGRKCLAVNISDVAAVAGAPLYALVSIGLPGNIKVEFVTELYQGLKSMADIFGVALVGGDISSSPSLIINITVMGKVNKDLLATRSGALVEDEIMVTGSLGNSALGLEILLREMTDLAPDMRYFVSRHLDPMPRVDEAIAAVDCGIKVIEDISDGLLTEISHICEMSGTGAIIDIDALPISESLKSVAKKIGADPVELALNGGEEYELVLTGPRNAAEYAAGVIEERTGTHVSRIGSVTRDTGLILTRSADGTLEKAVRFGYEHFKT